MDTRSRSSSDTQQAYVLHSYPYLETSLIVEIFTRERGRVALVARGARRPRSATRGTLLAFQPLLLTWSGKNELRTLNRAEWQGGGHAPLRGLALICGFYLNELLLKLLPRDDPHEGLFGAYRQTLAELAVSADHAAVLRRFEKNLLSELGYGLMLERDADTGAPIAAEKRYVYVAERGPLPGGGGAQAGVELDGQTLLDMQRDNYASTATQQQSKALMRAMINHCLGNKTLHTRQLLRDLQAL